MFHGPFFCVPLFMDPGEQPSTGAAQRRKQRRLRSWCRHEQQSIAAVLATSQHHSAQRGPKKARAEEEEESDPPQPVLFSLYEGEPGGARPASVAEPPGHTVEHIADFVCCAPMVQILDAPVGFGGTASPGRYINSGQT